MTRSIARIVMAASFACLAATTFAKVETGVTPPPPDPATVRQGGDTFADAFLMPMEIFSASGWTTGYTHDYDEVCPYSGSESPDVVYRVTPEYDSWVDIDLWGSEYDTKVYVYGAGMELIACNDDYYADYTSFIEGVQLYRGVKYYIVIDGYGGDHGQYHLYVGPPPPGGGEVECPSGAPLENEPPLEDGYVDAHNGGCTNLDQGLNLLDFLFDDPYCATSGWFDGGRDHDWYRGYTTYGHESVEVLAEVEQTTWLLGYGGADCGDLELRESVLVEPGDEGWMTVPGGTYEEIWIEVHPDLAVAPPGFEGNEYDYLIMQAFPVGEQPVAVQERSWTSVKGLFD